jgi:hypothetical protein
VLAAAALIHLSETSRRDAAREPDLARAALIALAAEQLKADTEDVHWLDSPGGPLTNLLVHPRVLVRARKEGEPADIYLTRMRLSPEGRLLELAAVYDLTETSAVDEQSLVVSGERAAWTIGTKDSVASFQFADLSGETVAVGGEWTVLKRWQHAITNWQATGQAAGVARRSFKLEPPGAQATVAIASDALVLNLDGTESRVPLPSGPLVGERDRIQEQEHHIAVPGNLITWAVDRVRALPWFGSDNMQLVKAVAFAGIDWTRGVVGTVTGDDGSERVADELGELIEVKPTTYTDPETGWPPAALKPFLKKPLEREGEWLSLENDPFIRRNPGAPAPFLTTFIRTDRERTYSQIFVTLWDPRQVMLHTMSGTVEPKSATGETGPGLVPRTPEVMSRLLAGFNGGFQAMHGEFGMMADDVMYLPPKPFAATVTVMQDGSNGFGTWPKEDSVPDEVVGFRQNMTAVVSDGVINPYQRNWWGGTPPGWTDESRTVRSGLCLTSERFVAYFYGTSIDANHLALAMQAARCTYGIHLDMNAGHTGLEFYKAAPVAELPPLGRALDGRWEAEDDVTDMPGWRFRGRRMLRFMGLMNFPRYINREARDFFYLTLRHVLPGDPLVVALQPPKPGEGEWTVKGLPQHGWPYAIATTFLRPDPARPDQEVRLLQLDPRLVGEASGDDGALVVAVAPRIPEATPTTSLWLDGQSWRVSQDAPSPKATRVLGGLKATDEAARGAIGIACVGRGGMLFYAELPGTPRAPEDTKLLELSLASLGCREALYVSKSAGFSIGGTTELSGASTTLLPKKHVRLARRDGPSAQRIFTETPVVHPDVWYPLQSKRVRYFKKPKKKSEDGAE